MNHDAGNAKSDVLEKAKAKLVAELLTPEEIRNVSGGSNPHWREFTRFVMGE